MTAASYIRSSARYARIRMTAFARANRVRDLPRRVEKLDARGAERVDDQPETRLSIWIGEIEHR